MLISGGRRPKPTSKKNRHLVLAVASGLNSRGTLLNSSSFSRWPHDLEAFAFCIHKSSFSQYIRIVGCHRNIFQIPSVIMHLLFVTIYPFKQEIAPLLLPS